MYGYFLLQGYRSWKGPDTIAKNKGLPQNESYFNLRVSSDLDCDFIRPTCLQLASTLKGRSLTVTKGTLWIFMKQINK
jgi:hypothetical protein